MSQSSTGIPYPGPDAIIDSWSERVYHVLATWPLAQTGKWSRWEPGYLLLEIDQVDGQPVDPILLYTDNEEVTVAYGFTHNHLDGEGPDEATPEAVAEQAKALIQDWLDGRFRTAVFTDADGAWCGTTLLQAGNLEAQLATGAQWIREAMPHTVQIRSPKEEDWETLSVSPNWLLAPKLSPGRLP